MASLAFSSSISSLTASFSSLSFSPKISTKPQLLSRPRNAPFPAKPLRHSLPPRLVVVASSAAASEVSSSLETSLDLEGLSLVKYVKARLPGGFAAQKLHGTGKRKTATARVVLKEGNGKFIINSRDASEYLQGNPLWLEYIMAPLVVLGHEDSWDIFVKVHGGGLSGQAQAISLGIARAFLKVDDCYKRPLKEKGLLTRNLRIVERKKAGLKKSRKAPQYSKR